MIKKQKNLLLAGKHQKPIVTDVFYIDNAQPKSVVIFCHGYKGFKDWGAWDLVANYFASQNYFFLKFNFSHNGGTSEQPIDFPDLDAFGHNNYIKELDDLQTVIDWVTAANFLYQNQINNDITLIGHSRGGGIATIKAAECTKVTTIISWAGVSDYASRYPTGVRLQKWKDDGVRYATNGRTQQEMPHYYQFYTNFKENEERLSISRAAKAIKIPHLIIHGTSDPTVSPEEAKALHQWNPNSELFLIPKADHVFGARHPWEFDNLPTALQTTVIESINFMKHS